MSFKRAFYSNRLLPSLGFVFITFLLPTGLFGQSFKQYVKKANRYFEKGLYFNALTYFNKAQEFDSTDSEVHFCMAESHRFLNQYPKAEWYYQKVWMRDGKNRFPQSQYWLGMMQKSNGKYRDASKTFDRFYRRFSRDSSSYFTQRSIIEIEACEWAQAQARQPDTLILAHLDSSVNSIHADFAPHLKDSSTLLFSSVRWDSSTTIFNRTIHARIYTSTGKDSAWNQAVQADTVFRIEGAHVSNARFFEPEKMWYFSVKFEKENKKQISGIYFAHEKDSGFSAPELFHGNLQAEGSESTQPFLIKDSLGQQWMFFSSNRPGGFGKNDIWYMKKPVGAVWGKAVNAGRFVNSPDMELCPSYDPSARKLWFSSTYFKGMGGLDIFFAFWNDSLMSFGKPENPGFPMNTAANELYYTETDSGPAGYFASNRTGAYQVSGESCCNDIYYFVYPPPIPPPDTIVPVEPVPVVLEVPHKEVILEQIRLLVPLTLYFHNDEPDPKTTAVTTTKTYDEAFRAYMKLKEKYQDEYAKGMKGEEKEKAREEIGMFFDQKVQGGFEGLERFAGLLLENLEEGRVCTLTLQGYCSQLASTDYNKNLAKRRIVSLKNYLMTYGNSVLLPYFSELPNKDLKGKLIIKEEDVGELPESTLPNDNLNDQRNSVYSRKAALERKIEIIAISAKD